MDVADVASRCVGKQAIDTAVMAELCGEAAKACVKNNSVFLNK